MNKAGKIYGIVSGLLALILIATVVLFCIPQTQAKMADWTAKFSPEHQKALDENKELMSSIEKLNGEISTKTQLIKDKDKNITNLNNELAESVQSINTLSTQKTTLLSVVTEIDNKINSTTDATEIENLEVKRASIIAQIDDLNEEIETLEQEKSQLEADIAVLQQEKTTLQNEIKQLKIEKQNLEKEVEQLELDKSDLEKRLGYLDDYKQLIKPMGVMISNSINQPYDLSLDISLSDLVDSIILTNTIENTSQSLTLSELGERNSYYSFEKLTINLKENKYVQGYLCGMETSELNSSYNFYSRNGNVINLDFSLLASCGQYDALSGSLNTGICFGISAKSVSTVMDTLTGTYCNSSSHDANSCFDDLVLNAEKNTKTFQNLSISNVFDDKFCVEGGGSYTWSYDASSDTFTINGQTYTRVS